MYNKVPTYIWKTRLNQTDISADLNKVYRTSQWNIIKKIQKLYRIFVLTEHNMDLYMKGIKEYKEWNKVNIFKRRRFHKEESVNVGESWQVHQKTILKNLHN